MEVAKTILQQLGGNKFIAMTGAKGLASFKNGLFITIPRANGINKIKVTLNSMDTYDMDFMYFSPKTLECKTVKSFNGVYNDQLQELFTEATGLYTHL